MVYFEASIERRRFLDRILDYHTNVTIRLSWPRPAPSLSRCNLAQKARRVKNIAHGNRSVSDRHVTVAIAAAAHPWHVALQGERA
jgi:hypothetical protein